MVDDYDPENHAVGLRDLVSGICLFTAMIGTLVLLSVASGDGGGPRGPVDAKQTASPVLTWSAAGNARRGGPCDRRRRIRSDGRSAATRG